MLEEAHEHLNNWELAEPEAENDSPPKKVGLVAVGVGAGITDILSSLGVDVVVEGGQTMNPSTEELLNACNMVNAESIIILPNNSNIIMTAEQVSHLIDDKEILVVPTKSIMQAITALIAFDDNGNALEMTETMTEEIKQVKYAEITQAVRDSTINGLDIVTGDIIGIIAGEIALVAATVEDALLEVIEQMVDDDSELITFFYGEQVSTEDANLAQERVTAEYSDYEIEVHYGGQPHYSYLVAVE